MEITLTKPLKIDEKEVGKIDLKLEDLTGEDILKVDLELRAEGNPAGFDNVYNQNVLLILASKATGFVVDDLRRLSAPDFLEVTFTVRNFLTGLLVLPEAPKTLEESSSN